MIKILIAGGTGYIGLNLAKHFLKQGIHVTLLSRKISFHPEFEVLACNAADYQNLKDTIGKSKFDIIINCVGDVDHSKFSTTNEENIYHQHFLATRNLVAVTKHTSITRFIQIGSGAEYGPLESPIKETAREQPRSPYALYKLCATNYLQAIAREASFPSVIIRVFQLYGGDQSDNRIVPSAINQLRLNGVFKCTSGVQKRNFLHIDDFVKLVDATVSHRGLPHGLIVNAGTTENISVRDLLNKIRDKIGSGTIEFGMKRLPDWESSHTFPDVSLAKEVLHWEPLISLNDGLDRLIQEQNND